MQACRGCPPIARAVDEAESSGRSWRSYATQPLASFRRARARRWLYARPVPCVRESQAAAFLLVVSVALSACGSAAKTIDTPTLVRVLKGVRFRDLVVISNKKRGARLAR